MTHVSKHTVHIAGIEVHVYGLDELRLDQAGCSVDIIFLLHGRKGNYEAMEPTAHAILKETWQLKRNCSEGGLLIVSFDQRNHGHRVVSAHANLSWLEGNQKHAEDMFSIYYGTSQDVSLIITLLFPCLFPQGQYGMGNVICVGVSLGGHATYLVLSEDDRVAAGVVIIGCPDFDILMESRAGKELLETRLPRAFRGAVARLCPRLDRVSKKEILILRGDTDQLVPWSASEVFVSQLPQDKVEIISYSGVGHEYNEQMLQKTVSWLCNWRK
ncbi:Alpha/Beta hydrolase protein [Rhexocercosporidium sp. MPI-PUGE-AT-0058]|nr:Alpha/Beta hydrolase protein [Rhexocercosporidium sp. MPI-PUGE-AT-0058]